MTVSWGMTRERSFWRRTGKTVVVKINILVKEREGKKRRASLDGDSAKKRQQLDCRCQGLWFDALVESTGARPVPSRHG